MTNARSWLVVGAESGSKAPAMRGRLPSLLLTLLAIGCPGGNIRQDTRPGREGGAQFLDRGRDTKTTSSDKRVGDTIAASLDRGVGPSPEGMVIAKDREVIPPDQAVSCTAMTADGIHLNPGCDPDVIASGATAVGGYQVNGKPVWQVTAGTKWWNLDPLADAGKGAFIVGGKDIAASYRAYGPACGVLTSDGIALNPGCDVGIQASGPKGVGGYVVNGKPIWQVTSSKKWWVFDPLVNAGQGAFVAGGGDIATAYRGLQPGCGALTSDGIALNPGCDPSVQASGLTAIGGYEVNGKPVWQVTSGKKWWVFDPLANAGQGAFVAGGGDIATSYRSYQPACGALTSDGIAQNPGCDPSVQASGLTALDGYEVSGKPIWQVTSGKKWWVFDPLGNAGQGAFVAGGADIATGFRGFKPY